MIEILFIAVTLILTIGTVFSMIDSRFWWMRVWDFPRLGIAVLALVLFIAAFVPLDGTALGVVAVLLAFVFVYQAYKIAPYTRLAKTEIAFVDGRKAAEDGHVVRFMSLNIYQFNRAFERTVEAVEKHDPDVLLMLETDQPWADAMAKTFERYPHRTLLARDNTYGMLFVSKLEVDDVEVRFLAQDDVPSIFAWMRTPGGRRFHYIGLHPRPPLPGQDTTPRDAEIARAAKIASEEELPVIVMGDFNDVAWSKTSQLFKRIGTYLDPRVGRGFFSTFPARMPWFRWPLDHIFMTEEFTVQDMGVLSDVGSDHLPVLADICLMPEEAAAINEHADPVDDDDMEEADKVEREWEKNRDAFEPVDTPEGAKDTGSN